MQRSSILYRTVLLICLMVLLLAGMPTIETRAVNGETVDVLNDTTDFSAVEKFSKQLQQKNDYVPQISVGGMISGYRKSGSFGETANNAFRSLLNMVLAEITGNSRLLLELLVISLLCAIMQNLQTSFGSSSAAQVGHYACFLIMALLVIKSFALVVGLGRETIGDMIELTRVMMPPLITIMALSGGAVSAATLDPVILISIQITSDIIKDLILPMAVLVAVLNLVDALSDSVKITRLAELLKQVNLFALGFIMTVFIGVITIRSSTSATIDQVALKTTKFAVDNFIPIVGKCLSDAVSTVAGYSMILKDAASLVGLLLMVFICAVPLIKIVVLALIYKLVGAVIEPVVDERVSNCLSAVGGAMGIIFASVLSVAVMFFIMTTVVATTGRLIMMVR